MINNTGITVQSGLVFLDFKDVKKGRTFVLLTSIISIQRDGDGAVITLDSGLEISVQLTVTAVMATIAETVKCCRREHPEAEGTVPVMFITSFPEEDKASLDRPMHVNRLNR